MATQRVLVHRVAVIKIADHQAINLFQLGKYGLQHAGFVRHPQGENGVGQHQNFVDGGPQRAPLRKVRADGGKARRDLLFGLPGESNAVARDELQQAKQQRRIGVELLRRAKMNPPAHHGEIGIREARAAIPELREQRAGAGFAGFDRPQHQPVNHARMPEIVAHHGGRIATQLIANPFLRIECQHVRIAAGLLMQQRTQQEKIAAGFFNLGGIGQRRRADLVQPAQQLQIAQSARSFLDVRFQVMDTCPENGRGGRGSAANRCRARASRWLCTNFGSRSASVPVERGVAGEITLIQQADVQLNIAFVKLGAFLRRAHRIADAQARVPQPLQECRDGVAPALRRPLAGKQQQQVDVGMREKLAASVTADGQQSRSGRRGGRQRVAPGIRHQPVNGGGTLGERRRTSKCCFSAIVIPDPYRLGDVVHENFSVADFSRARRSGQRAQNFLQPGIGDHQLDLHFRQQIDVVFLAAIDLFVALLPAVAADLGDGHPVHANALERFLHFVQFERLNDGFDFLHGAS